MTTLNPILALLDRLDALEAKATPGPWEWEVETWMSQPQSDYGALVAANGNKVLTWWADYASDAGLAVEADDARVVQEWRNHGPTLSRALRIAVEALGQGLHPGCKGHDRCQNLIMDNAHSAAWCDQSCRALSEIAALAEGSK